MTKELIKIRKHFKESNILFQSDKAEAIDAAIEAVEYHRIELETYVRLRPHFAKTLQPITVDTNAPLIIQKMANAAMEADVGPMAAVAGALADLAVEAMVRSGSRVSIVEDGGEVSAISDESFTVGLYAGQNALGHGLGFMIKPFDCPIGIATSSSTVSHAMSFGEADAAVIFAENASIADAAATSVCNSVVGDDVANSIKLGLEVGKKISLVRGTLVVRGDYVGSAGWVPSLVQIEP